MGCYHGQQCLCEPLELLALYLLARRGGCSDGDAVDHVVCDCYAIVAAVGGVVVLWTIAAVALYWPQGTMT
eukprot:835517-Amphidinium_carterae.1